MDCRAYRDGHQIASHTWSHKYLPGLDPSEALAEVTLLEDALKNIIGVRPTYLRPPYGAIDRPTLELLGERNYTVVGWDIDTQDWAHSDDAEASLKYYRTLFNNTEEINKPGHIVLQHEVYQTTSLHVAPVAIDLALINGYKVVTVGECIGDDKSNWYSD
ncbi:chitin deacetylase [Actinomortierella wolfii]|nr:chitin deacetylase [Actinomortierella wolfii]